MDEDIQLSDSEGYLWEVSKASLCGLGQAAQTLEVSLEEGTEKALWFIFFKPGKP